ncbi:MarR family winged helix-turn-helix transcriptional regulator [Saccharopolyspora hordei]|uniref:MarR family winged helix-turn-helix transcriptional regulator n=1 Tax=Saccharopolyspora hordei TaxID=1838 RepID=UPI0035EDDDE9
MARAKPCSDPAPDDVDAVTDAVLTASRLLVAVSARSLAAVENSLTLPQFRLLVVLFHAGPLKLAALAETLGVNPSTVTRMIDRLVGTELVDRRPNPASRRENVVALTQNGVDVVAEVTARRRSEIARIVKRMPAAARRGRVGALPAFVEAGGELPGVGPACRTISAQWV